MQQRKSRPFVIEWAAFLNPSNANPGSGISRFSTNAGTLTNNQNDVVRLLDWVNHLNYSLPELSH